MNEVGGKAAKATRDSLTHLKYVTLCFPAWYSPVAYKFLCICLKSSKKAFLGLLEIKVVLIAPRIPP